MKMRTRAVLPFLLFGVMLGASCFAAAQSGAQTEKAETALSASRPAKAASEESQVPTVAYRLVFKGSTPEYVRIVVGKQGPATYDIRQLSEPASPQPFQVSPALTEKIFSLAADLHDFNGIQLEARRRIANLGQKTFSYTDGGQSYQVSFNYTLNAKANQLLDIFQSLSVEGQYLDQLHNSMRYDPLGLDDVLMRLQSDLAARNVAEPKALVPLLQQIVSNRQFLDVARQRAGQIIQSIDRTR